MNTLSLEYKIGIKKEIVNALRKVFDNDYPDEQLRGKVKVHAEYPLSEITYPMVLVKFNPGKIQNIGIGWWEYDETKEGDMARVLHWMFEGSLAFEVYALTPLDRDMVIVGLVNLFAFGTEIPGFVDFHNEISDYDYVAMSLMMDHMQEGGDSVVTVPWGNQDEPVFTDSITLDLIGEFFTNPTTGALVRINAVKVYPYRPEQPVPEGSIDSRDATDGWYP